MTALTLTTADGVSLRAELRSVPEPHAAVVVVHGFTAHGDDEAVRSLADALQRDGHDVITYDSRGHGESGGRCTLGDHEVLDVAAAVERARRQAPRVVVVGASMGAIAALRYAADHPDLDGLVTVSCPARWRVHSARAAAAAVLTRTGIGRRFAARRLGVRVAERWTSPEAPIELAARVACPMAVVHGTADRFLPVLEAQRLHQAGQGDRRRLELVAGMGHAFDAAGQPTVQAAVAWTLAGPLEPAPR